MPLLQIYPYALRLAVLESRYAPFLLRIMVFEFLLPLVPYDLHLTVLSLTQTDRQYILFTIVGLGNNILK